MYKLIYDILYRTTLIFRNNKNINVFLANLQYMRNNWKILQQRVTQGVTQRVTTGGRFNADWFTAQLLVVQVDYVEILVSRYINSSQALLEPK